jgi:peptidoglycan/LPS O-acetylase OafA/YrhL
MSLRRWGSLRSIPLFGFYRLRFARIAPLLTAPRILLPAFTLGRWSYEIYLAHMFVVFTLFALFARLGKPFGAVPLLFLGVVLAATLFGGLIHHLLRASEP